MMNDETVYKIIFIILVISMISTFVGLLYYESICTYETVTAIVQDKYIDEYTTMTVFSNGKCAWTAPVHHTDYFLNTSYGDIQVDNEIYEKYNVSDHINLTKNLNTSTITLKER